MKIMKTTFPIVLLFIFFWTNAQQQILNHYSGKGVKPHSKSQQLSYKNTFAVVVGISDYQDQDIPDLKYADKDAELFAQYLRSTGGGALDDDHLKVLINSKATMAQFAKDLDWLMENAKEGDQAIIYFSGHGDVEKRTLTQPGFLLCWDAPAQVYMAGGALALPMLQEVISTLSIQNKAKVIVITDACRSGILAGSSVDGSHATAANLAKQYANEIKILSCQPNEYSIEGEQWGGGRGAFSYHLVDGLYGLADENNDQRITLQEISRYLEDHVPKEVDPEHQLPMIIGNRYEQIAKIDSSTLASIRSGKTNQMAMLASIESKGIEQVAMQDLDSSTRKLYQSFNDAIRDKIFLRPIGACADSYFKKLISEPSMAKLHSTLRRNYAAALQDDAQQVLNKILKGDLKEHNLSSIQAYQKYHPYSAQLERAAALLGEQHYMYPILQARKYFFEGYILTLTNSWQPNKESSQKALSLYRQALQWQSDLPHAFLGIAYLYGSSFLQADSAEYYTRIASTLSPTWILPYTNLAYLSSEKMNDHVRAKYFIEKGRDLDSNSSILLNTEGIFYYRQSQYALAEEVFKKAIALDSSITSLYVNLGNVYADSQRFPEAEKCYLKAIRVDSTIVETYTNLGDLYVRYKTHAEAEQLYFKAIQMDSTQSVPYYNLACISSIKLKIKESFEYLEFALKNGLNKYDWMQQDTDLAALREKKEQWKELMKKYFPERMKH